MAEHPNAAMARRTWDAMMSGDMATVAEAFADDIVWYEIGRAEPRRGKAELADAFVPTDYELVPTLVDITASDDHIVVITDAVATRAGRTFSYRAAEIFTVRDGKVVERRAFSDDTAAITAFFA